MQNQTGFTLIELLIVIAMIGILVVIAIPSYETYTRRAHYTEIVQAAAPYKLGVEQCYQFNADLSTCEADKNGVPPETHNENGSNLINTIEVQNGVITITPHEKFGIKSSDTYILTPIAEEDQLNWHTGGGGVAHGYAR